MIKMQNKIFLVLFLTLSFIKISVLAQYKKAKVDEFAKAIKENEQAVVVDVRTAEEYNGGHLYNAINVDVRSNDFEKNILALDKAKPILVYCLAGSRSKTAADYLIEKGFSYVTDLEGGFLKWTAAKKPITKAETKLTEKAMTLAEFKDIIKAEKVVFVDFFATWCGPCKKMMPTVKRLEKTYEGKIKVLTIDTDRNKNVAIQNLVNELPTMILFKNGKEFWRGVGEQDTEFLEDLFELNATK